MLLATLFFFLGVMPVFAAEKSCGVERWDVKTLNDAEGADILASAPMMARIGDLVKIATHDRKTLMQAEAKRFPEERRQFKVPALVIGYKKEGDSDFHIVLADPDDRKATTIAEIPSADCVPAQYREMFAQLQARFAADFGKPTAKYKKLAKPVRITAAGIFFFDFIHGQTGVAKNGAELHPLLDWELPKAAAPAQPKQLSAGAYWTCRAGDFWAHPTPVGVIAYRIGLTRLFGVKCEKESY